MARRIRKAITPAKRKRRHYRHLWYFTCRGCGKTRRRSHRKAAAVEGLCGHCRRDFGRDERQMTIDAYGKTEDNQA